MIQIIKRLELIKTAIAIEDEEIIELQVVKLSTLDIDNKVANILTMIESGDYGKVAIAIEDYINKYSGVVVYEDAEVQGLRLELKALEKKLRKLSEEKTETLNSIDEFNSQYNLNLGELLQEVLSIRKKILKQKALQKEQEYVQVKEDYDEAVYELEEVEKRKEDIAQKLQDADLDDYDELFEELKNVKQEYDEVKETVEEKEKIYEELKEEKEKEQAEHTQAEEEYEEFSNHYVEELAEEHFDLTDEEKKELKKLYRKASKLCHPDIVEIEVREQAEQIFIALNEAYVKNDLEEVREILISLEKGIKFDIASDSIDDAEILKEKIDELKKKVQQEKVELDEIKNDESYEIIEELDDWDVYFEELKTNLEDEVVRLQGVLGSILETDHKEDENRQEGQLSNNDEQMEEIWKSENEEFQYPSEEPKKDNKTRGKWNNIREENMGETTIIKFDTAEDAQEYAREHIWATVSRSDSGKGYITIVNNENKINIINNALMEAMKIEDLDSIAYYLREGANPNLLIGHSPLIVIASRNNNYRLIEILVEAGADVNSKTGRGNTALIAAASNENLKLIKYLIEERADVDAKTEEGNTALMYTTFYDNVEIANCLLEAGANPDVSREDGCSPLERAARNNYHGVLMSLLEAGADVNVKLTGGKTIFLLSVYKAEREVIEAFLNAGADVNARDDFGNTPLISAVSAGCLDKVQALLEAGAIVDVKPSKSGRTPLNVAKEQGFLDIENALLNNLSRK